MQNSSYPGRYYTKPLALILIISFIALFVHIRRPLPIQSPLLRPSHSVNPDNCQCFNNENKYIIKLHRPWHHFDSNHWFHICEYYLSRHRLIDSYVPDNSSLVIVSDDPGFTVGVTEMTLFFMMLSFTKGNPKEVIVYDPPHHMSSVIRGNDSMRKFAYNGPVYRYERDAPLEKRYSLYSTFEQYSKNIPHLSSNYTSPYCTCGTFAGEYGSAPIDRGYWFSDTQDVSLFRAKISSLCPVNEIKQLLEDHRDIVVPFRLSYDTKVSLPESPPSLSTSIESKITSSSSHDSISQNETNIIEKRRNHTHHHHYHPGINRTHSYHPNNTTISSTTIRSNKSRFLLSSDHKPNDHNKNNHNENQENINKIYKIVIYQRNEDRKFLDLEGVMKHLQITLKSKWSITVLYHEEKLEPCLLSAVLGDADIFLTTHGFQSMAILFMKLGSVIIEVFPYKYWKVGYKPLSEEMGVHHRWIQNDSPVSSSRDILYFFPEKLCMRSLWCRDFSRGDDVLMTPDMIKTVIQTAHDIESNKIGVHNAPAIFGMKR